MNSSIYPLENFLSSSSSLYSSMSFTDLLNTSYQQPPSSSQLQFRSDLPPLQKLPPVPNNFTNFDSIPPDLNNDEWFCSPAKEDDGGGVDSTGDGDGGEEMDSQIRVSSNPKSPLSDIVSRLQDPIQEPNLSPMEECIGVKTIHSYSADSVLHEFCSDSENENVYDELVNKMMKKQEDMYKVLLETIEQKEKDGITEELVNKMMKKQEDVYKVLLEKQEDNYRVILQKQEDMYKVLLETIEHKEKDRITEELLNKMMKKQEDMYKVLLEKQEDKYKVVLKKQEDTYKVLFETIEQKEKDRITGEEIWRNLERERMRKETEQMEKDRITREETWRNLQKERMGKEEEMRAEDSSRSLSVLSLLGKFLGQQVIDNAGPLGQQEINTPQSIEQQKINIPQSSEIIWHDRSGQKKQRFHNWTKHEAQALISVRMAIEQIFQTGARKSRMSWEEISLGMASMGFTKTAKQCRDKWETMKKCFKRAERSGKTKAENAKTFGEVLQELDMFHEKLLIDFEKVPKAET
ncbi:hypothetical protein MKW98_005985 [Papaver atlanticum]|uniref:Myb-like domain-containing protein n=1 Tax=Papaver atlanticum TaxID=357466 RepID=A0AAD4S8P6_9MAGN|nr:hypothetical protein MKW98_005985 [Papaver atlanticum]